MKYLLVLLWVSVSVMYALPEGAVQYNEGERPFVKGQKPFPPVQMLLLEGEPLKKGIYTFRIKVPAFKKIPPHWHLKDERVTVLKGKICISFSEKVDYTKGNCIQSGGFYINPKEARHYLWTKEEETLLQVTGEGPWGMKFDKKEK